MNRPLVFKFSRDEYKTSIVVSDYDTMTYHGTELPASAPQDLIIKFFEEAEIAATKQMEKMYDNMADSRGWEQELPPYRRGE